MKTPEKPGITVDQFIDDVLGSSNRPIGAPENLEGLPIRSRERTVDAIDLFIEAHRKEVASKPANTLNEEPKSKDPTRSIFIPEV